MTTADDILAFIEDNPDDDTARLVYAEFLDYDGYSPRAELIRVGVELAPLSCLTPSIGAVIEGKPAPCYMCRPRQKQDCLPWCENCCRREDLMGRQRELLTQHAAEFRRGPQCEACKGKSAGRSAMCLLCGNTGDLGGLMRMTVVDSKTGLPPTPDGWWHKVEFHRGFPRVFCRIEECVQVKTTGGMIISSERETVPTDWLLSVVRHHRGVEVWVTDKNSERNSSTGKTGIGWRSSRDDSDWSLPAGPDYVPWTLWQLLDGYFYNNDWYKFYDTVTKAQVALARAIPAWARGHMKR